MSAMAGNGSSEARPMKVLWDQQERQSVVNLEEVEDLVVEELSLTEATPAKRVWARGPSRVNLSEAAELVVEELDGPDSVFSITGPCFAGLEGGSPSPQRRPTSSPAKVVPAAEEPVRPSLSRRDLVAELQALRRDLTDHHARVFNVVKQRLDKLGLEPVLAIDTSDSSKSSPAMDKGLSAKTPAVDKVPSAKSPTGIPVHRGRITKVDSGAACEVQPSVQPSVKQSIMEKQQSEGFFSKRGSLSSDESQATPPSNSFSAIMPSPSMRRADFRKSLRMTMKDMRTSVTEDASQSFEVSNQKRGIFADVEGMKEQLRRNLLTKQYRVEDQYYETGWCRAIAQHPAFELVTLFIVLLNALWIGYDLDANDAPSLNEAGAGFQIIEHLFCLYFTAEIGTRLGAFRVKMNAFKDMQFVFDFVLLSFMVIETWILYIIVAISPKTTTGQGFGALSALRILRLTRIARLVRLLRAKQELMVLIKGLMAASRAVGWTFVLMVVIIYIFAVAFKTIAGDSDVGRRYFSTIPDGMVTLTLPGLLPDNEDAVLNMGPLYGTMFMVFIIIGSVTMMNMLIGVLCETVTATAAVEKESLCIAYVRGELEYLLSCLGKTTQDNFTTHDIEAILISPHAGRCFAKVGVDMDGLVDIADFLMFGRKSEISFPDFLDIVLQLRGSNVALVSHIVNLQKFIVEEMTQLEHRFQQAVQDGVQIICIKMDESTTGSKDRKVGMPNLPSSMSTNSRATVAPSNGHKVEANPSVKALADAGQTVSFVPSLSGMTAGLSGAGMAGMGRLVSRVKSLGGKSQTSIKEVQEQDYSDDEDVLSDGDEDK